MGDQKAVSPSFTHAAVDRKAIARTDLTTPGGAFFADLPFGAPSAAAATLAPHPDPDGHDARRIPHGDGLARVRADQPLRRRGRAGASADIDESATGQLPAHVVAIARRDGPAGGGAAGGCRSQP